MRMRNKERRGIILFGVKRFEHKEEEMRMRSEETRGILLIDVRRLSIRRRR